LIALRPNPTAFSESIVIPVIDEVIASMAEVIQQGIARKLFLEDVNAANAADTLAGMVNYFFLSSLATAKAHQPFPEGRREADQAVP
jgi:TetR/AcrR family transcriptional regulator